MQILEVTDHLIVQILEVTDHLHLTHLVHLQIHLQIVQVALILQRILVQVVLIPVLILVQVPVPVPVLILVPVQVITAVKVHTLIQLTNQHTVIQTTLTQLVMLQMSQIIHIII